MKHLSKKIPKTLNRLLKDLDDHLYLLKEAYDGVRAGEMAHLKALSAELRVLVCLSHDTEGLLWRLAERLHVEDTVSIHFVGTLDTTHPLALGVRFAFVPLMKAGEGDPRIPPGTFSLKDIIKKGEALFITGRGYTYEDLIKHVAQQIGSAHEDSGVAPHLVELSEINLGGRGPLVEVLLSVASMVLEVGARLLNQAQGLVGFIPKTRPSRAAYPPPGLQEMSQDSAKDYDQEVVELPKEGAVVFGIHCPDEDWTRNHKHYAFGKIRKPPLDIEVVKHADGTLELGVHGICSRPITVRHPIPYAPLPGVQIAIIWNPATVEFYINGQSTKSLSEGLDRDCPY